MNKPEYFFSDAVPWNEWLTIDRYTFDYEVGSLNTTALFRSEDVDAKYPGFTKAYGALYDINADTYSTASVLKFCIASAAEKDLHDFLVSTDTLSKVEIGLSLGLSGDALAAALCSDSYDKSPCSALPGDLSLDPSC